MMNFKIILPTLIIMLMFFSIFAAEARADSGPNLPYIFLDEDSNLFIQMPGPKELLIYQSGEMNISLQIWRQLADFNSEVYQEGERNFSFISQTGEGNRASVNQTGSGNTAVIKQSTSASGYEEETD